MLSELTISDFAIIDKLHLRFGPGFNVLTGETGAGKSIIIDAVSLLLGGRGEVAGPVGHEPTDARGDVLEDEAGPGARGGGGEAALRRRS